MQKKLLLIAAIAGLSMITSKNVIAAEKSNRYTQINITESEMSTVEQDKIIISLRAESQNESAIQAQNDLNKIMSESLKTSKEYHKDIKVKTTSYNVYERHEPIHVNFIKTQKKPEEMNKYKIVYTATQNIVLESKNFEKALELTGILQEKGLMTNNIGFTVSYEKREETKNKLISKTLDKIKYTAETIAHNMNMTIKGYKEIDIHKNSHMAPMPRMYGAEMMMAKTDAMTAPVAEAGDENISITISAKINIGE